MKLEVGMYVRTKYGDVFILDKIEDNCLIPRYVYIPCIIIEEDVIKASHNIIDLIEVGDYVNGCKVIDFMYSKEKKRSVIVDSEIWGFDSEEIKSIVTKEQFESMKYSLEG